MDIEIVESKNSLLKDNSKVFLLNKKKLHLTVYSTSNKVSHWSVIKLVRFIVKFKFKFKFKQTSQARLIRIITFVKSSSFLSL